MTPGALSETDLATLLGLVCRAHRLALWHWTLPEQSIRVFSECAELDFGKATQWNEILDHPDHALMMAAFQRAHASGFDQFSVTCKACPEKGTGVPVSLRGKIAEYDAKGYPASIVGMMQATAPTAGPVQSGEEKKG